MTVDVKCDVSSEVRVSALAVSELCCTHLISCTHPEESSRRRSLLFQARSRQSRLAPSRLVRWMKFNFVGGIGVAVQFAALYLLKAVLHFDYLVATAIAVEAAVLHNFVWHERFTWADRTGTDRIGADRAARAEVDGNNQHQTSPSMKTSSSSWRGSLTRLLRFQLANGAVSIVGNLALVKLMVGVGHIHYLAANGIAIALCSLANFLVSDEWVFGDGPATDARESRVKPF
jgi:putative flippase GtrA